MVEAASDAVRDWPGAWLRLAGGWVANIKIGGCVHSLSQSTTHFDRAGRYIVRPEIEGAATRKIETRKKANAKHDQEIEWRRRNVRSKPPERPVTRFSLLW
jgi:hypothetical protein